MTNLCTTYGSTSGVVIFGIIIAILLAIAGIIYSIRFFISAEDFMSIFKLLISGVCICGAVLVISITAMVGDNSSKENIKKALKEKYEVVHFNSNCGSTEGEFETLDNYYKYVIEDRRIKIYNLGAKEEQSSLDDIIE